VATLYLGLRETEKTFDWLDKAFEDRDPVPWWIKSDQLSDRVRAAPRFQALTKKIADPAGRDGKVNPQLSRHPDSSA
jgi:hypothetical protein